MGNFKDIATVYSVLRSVEPMLIVTYPSAHSIALALSLLVLRYYLGLETHLTFAGSVGEERIGRLMQNYQSVLLIGLEGGSRLANSQGNVFLISHSAQGGVSSLFLLNNITVWPRLPRILYLTHIVGLSLDEYATTGKPPIMDAVSYGLVKLTNTSLPLSLHDRVDESLAMSLWPLIMDIRDVDISSATNMLESVVNGALRRGFLGSYLDYFLEPTYIVNGVNLTLIYLGLESMTNNITVRDDGLAIPELNISEISRIAGGNFSSIYDRIREYVSSIRSRVLSLLSELEKSKGERLVEHEIKPSNMVLMNRLCQVFSFHKSRGSIRFTTTYGGLKLVCIPSVNVDLAMDKAIAVNRGLRYIQVAVELNQ